MAQLLRLTAASALLAASASLAAQDNGSDPPGRQAFRVDDSGSFVVDPFLEMQWKPGLRGPEAAIVGGATRVSVQLDTRPWIGRSGRIYMVLARGPGPTVRATWTTGGLLQPGTLLSGDRSLVYAGPVTGPLMRDIIDIRLEVDGTRLSAAQALSFGFEIELEP